MAATNSPTLRLLMGIILLAAVDLGLIRRGWHDGDQRYLLEVLVFLPMATLLVLVFPRSRRGHPSRLFWAGFEVTGWVGMIGILAFIMIDQDDFVFPLLFILRSLDLMGPQSLTERIAIALALYTPPQVLIAAFAGWLVARYRLVIERR